VTLPTGLCGKLRKVRKVRKVYSLLFLGEEQIPTISVTVIHQFQSPSGKNFPHIPHIPQCRWTHKAVHAARAGPGSARSTTVRVRASMSGKS
jgi:hypothetical protein